MQLLIEHELLEELVLPINYHQIIQGIIYSGLQFFPEYGDFLHNKGYSLGERQYRLFTFSLLKGKYRIEEGKIIFMEHISFEIRSMDVLMLKTLKKNLEMTGIQYQRQKFEKVKAVFGDMTVESNEIYIRMKSPMVVYETESVSGRTHFFNPDEKEFFQRIQDNFVRKYYAYAGIEVTEGIEIYPIRVTKKDKYVTKYKGYYITGWLGVYRLKGPRKYLDFLYQTGLGSKNAQGFGMFEIIEKNVFSCI